MSYGIQNDEKKPQKTTDHQKQNQITNRHSTQIDLLNFFVLMLLVLNKTPQTYWFWGVHFVNKNC
ncbi:hypothetical protein DHW03_16295 [Pedobacter yonginense]|uniref:Uncharacterized protein n=1 Tax=Pedobacter yonginense TaxID=651869 RepID=A0A317EHQ6_9SPHI|nr:hypothetical protein DHW03_16295 [Pedobacter yonginense]